MVSDTVKLWVCDGVPTAWGPRAGPKLWVSRLIVNSGPRETHDSSQCILTKTGSSVSQGDM